MGRGCGKAVASDEQYFDNKCQIEINTGSLWPSQQDSVHSLKCLNKYFSVHVIRKLNYYITPNVLNKQPKQTKCLLFRG